MVHNLSYPFKGDSVNESIEYGELKLSGFGHAARAVREYGAGCYLVKLDVEAAYKQVPVRPDDWFLLGFKWLGQYYYERVLPFGLKSSCRLWELYAAALRHFFAESMVLPFARIVIHYVDDFLFVVQCESDAVLLRDGALRLCKELGIPMSAGKTEGPTTQLTFLGIELDTVAMQARLSDARKLDLTQLCTEWEGKKSACIKELQSLTGILHFACQVVRPGKFYLRRIIDHTSFVETKVRSPNEQYPLTGAVRADIQWWIAFLPSWSGESLLYEQEWSSAEVIELWTDACNTGYGGYYAGAWFAGAWSPSVLADAHRQTRISMPYLELYALVQAAVTFGAHWAGKKITFRCDCLPVVHAITKCSSRRPEMMHLLRLLARVACTMQFDFRCVHIPGVENSVADILSRDGDCAQFRAMRPHADREAMTAPTLPPPPPPQPHTPPSPPRRVQPSRGTPRVQSTTTPDAHTAQRRRTSDSTASHMGGEYSSRSSSPSGYSRGSDQ